MRLRIIFIIIVIVYLILTGGAIYSIKRPLVSINKKLSVGDKIANEFEIIMDKNKEILLTLVSTVKEGNIKIQLLDGYDTIIREFDSNTKEKATIFLEKGIYYMRAYSELFRGSYNIKVHD